MDKVTKFLRKRNKKERLLLIATIDLIVNKKINNLDIRKVKSCSNIFRVRIGDFRIIFKRDKPRNNVIKIDNKNDQTYKI